MAPKFCWLFQLLHKELMISEKCCFIYIIARYPTWIHPVTSILQVPPMTFFCVGLSSSDRKEKDIQNGQSHTNIHARASRLKGSFHFACFCDWLISMSVSAEMQIYSRYSSKCHRTAHSVLFWSSQKTQIREIWLFYVHKRFQTQNFQIFTPSSLSNSYCNTDRKTLPKENTADKKMHGQNIHMKTLQLKTNQSLGKPLQHLQRQERARLTSTRFASTNPQQMKTLLHQTRP